MTILFCNYRLINCLMQYRLFFFFFIDLIGKHYHHEKASKYLILKDDLLVL